MPQKSLVWLLMEDINEVFKNVVFCSVVSHITGDNIHTFEHYMAAKKEERKKDCGAVYTPQQVVSFIVQSVDEILRDSFDQNGLNSENINIIDPAGGTGAFLCEVLKNTKNMDIVNRIKMFEIMQEASILAMVNISRASGCDVENIYQIVDNSNALDYIPQKTAINIIIGNPPYNENPSNKYDTSEYRQINGVQIDNKNWRPLKADYVKFIRFAQNCIGEYGIVAYITSHSYIDNITFSGMRQSLLDTFDEIYILDLHGSIRKNEKCPDGSKDENIFSIKQGVCISFFVKNKALKSVKFAEIFGLKNRKLDFLNNNSWKTIKWSEIAPVSPNYFFKPHNNNSEYSKFDCIYGDIFLQKISGIETGNDDVAIAFNANVIENRIEAMIKYPDEDTFFQNFNIPQKNNSKLGAYWHYDSARFDVIYTQKDYNKIKKILYRQFDFRYTYFTGHTDGFHRAPRRLMHDMENNLAILVTKRTIDDKYSHVFITDTIFEASAASRYVKSYGFPLTVNGKSNTNPNFAIKIMNALGISVTDKEILYYCYAILNSQIYRDKYENNLKYNYPRIPIVNDILVFYELCSLGMRLTELHLMRSVSKSLSISYKIPGNNKITKIRHENSRLYINNTQYFENVPEITYKFVSGGYQIVKKWLTDRENYTLIDCEINYVIQLNNILYETIQIQKIIDSYFGKMTYYIS